MLSQAEIDSLLNCLSDGDSNDCITFSQNPRLAITENIKQTIIRSLEFEMDYLKNRLKEVEVAYLAISE